MPMITKLHMINLRIKKIQIFNSVISSIAIYMVDNFSWFKVAFNFLFNQISMVVNSSIFISKRMGWCIYSKISSIKIYSTFKVGIILSKLSKFFEFVKTRFRTKLLPCFPILNTTKFSFLKKFMAILTFFNIFHISNYSIKLKGREAIG